MNIELKHLRKRFVSDMNLPIQVIQTPYFEERIELLEEEYGAKTKYENLLSIIENKFNGSINEFLEYYSKTRDKIVNYLKSTKAFANFNNGKVGQSHGEMEYIGQRNLYTQEQDGGLFISLDMKKANFQTLRYIDKAIMLGADTYENLIGLFTDMDYIKESKYTRQVIFGQMNPRKTMNLEREITTMLAHSLIDGSFPIGATMDFNKFNVFSVNSDEVIFKFNGTEEEFEKCKPYVNDIVFKAITFRFNKFKLHHRQFKLATSESPLNVFEKEDYLDGHKRHLHCVPSTYYPQVYKLINGMEIKPSDLVFYYEHELCQFMNPIELVK